MDAFNAIRWKVMGWYDQNKRALPWRETSDPYKIWVSEIILQQTQVIQGTNYYHRFIQQFPDVMALANASEQEVLKIWQGLGYYSRARNMHHTAKDIATRYGGAFPSDYKQILALKGIGEYTAAAIASIAFDLPYAALDGNVARVLARLFKIEEPINSTDGKKILNTFAASLLNREEPGKFNQAMMEFGALFCTPKTPRCSACPLTSNCLAYHTNTVNRLPLKTSKQKQRLRYFIYFLFIHNETICLKKRSGNDIWKGLYEFPLLELPDRTDENGIPGIVERQNFTFPVRIDFISREYMHILSHQKITARFVVMKTSYHPKKQQGEMTIEISALSGYPISRLTDRFLQEYPLETHNV